MSVSIVPDIVGRLNVENDETSSEEELSELMDKMEFFNNLNPEELGLLAKGVKVYSAKKGRIIFKEGEQNAWLCILTEGKLLIYKHGPSEKEKQIAMILPGKCIGEMSLIDGEPLSATVAAAEDCKVLLISNESFMDMMDKHPIMGNKMLWKISSILVSRLRRTTEWLAKTYV